MVIRHESARKSVETTFSANASTIQLQIDEAKCFPDGAPIRAAPPEDGQREEDEEEDEGGLSPRAAPGDPKRGHAARASSRAASRHLLVDPLEPARDLGPGVALDCERPSSLAERDAARLVLDECRDGVGERSGVAGRDRDRRGAIEDLAVPRDVRRDGRQRAREGAGQHHPEALLAERGRDERLSAEQRPREVGLAQEADDVDALVGDAEARDQEPDRKRIRARDRQPEPRSTPDLRPRAQQHLEALPRLLAPGEDDPVLPLAGRRVRPAPEHRSESRRTRPAATSPATRAHARTPRCGSRCGRSGTPRAAFHTSSSRGRRTHGTSRRAGTWP